MTVVAIANHKGGVGKTTTTVNLGAALRELGRRVLLVDLDPQASLTIHLGVRSPERLPANCGHVLKAAIVGSDSPTLRTVLIRTASGLDLIPSGWQLSDAEVLLGQNLDWAFALRKCLEPLLTDYDYILIDCLPSRNRLVFNALAASDYVLVPVQADYLAIQGLTMIFQTAATVRDRLNPQLQVLGILVTMVDLRTRHSRRMVGAIRRSFHGRIRVFDTAIRFQVGYKDSSVAATSHRSYAARPATGDDYLSLAREVILAAEEPPNAMVAQDGSGDSSAGIPLGDLAASALAQVDEIVKLEVETRAGLTTKHVRGGDGRAPVPDRNGYSGGGPLACPFLGLEQDRFRRLAQPADSHRCWANRAPTPVDCLAQQRDCLQAWYWQCATFRKYNDVGRQDPVASFLGGLLARFRPGR